ncbi:hypothetical protein [Riemerella columbipharyngis]|uniref:Uncharacterized protein n=1 Tax=Riemerella columbipharyngis TaxID=1071918 RepID=A0A1G7A6S3_9FLAO|nr:hypothetical protein [Riemerella columbipharyngis]SDE10197.1 hypothetical protein SAMN05421544_10361 [Riemerella columbipharyngis]
MKNNNKGVTMYDSQRKKMSGKELFDRVTKEAEDFRKTHNNPIEKRMTWIR